MNDSKLKTNLVNVVSAAKEATVNQHTISRLMTPEQIYEKEFNRILNLDKLNHTSKTVDLLNTFFNSDPKSEEVILMVNNLSKCNMILDISGNKKHQLAIPFNDEKVIILKKGKYHLLAKVCKKSYNSHKFLKKNLKISLQ